MRVKQNASILTALIGLIFTLVVFYAAPEKKWDWLISFTGTVISFLTAVIAGLYLFEKQEEAKKRQDRVEILSMLKAELGDMKRLFSDTTGKLVITLNGQPKPVLVTYVQPLIVEKAATSGLFSVVHTENLLHLGRKVRMFNVKTQYLLGLLSSGVGTPAISERLHHAIDNIESTREAILADIDRLMGVS